MTHSGWGQDLVFKGDEKSAAVREGSGKPLPWLMILLALPWPFGPHVAG